MKLKGIKLETIKYRAIFSWYCVVPLWSRKGYVI